MSRLFVRDLYWFPVESVSMNWVKKHFTLTLFESEEEQVVLDCWVKKEIKGVPYVGLPRGDTELVKNALLNEKDWSKIKDRRSTNNRDLSRLKFMGQFRSYQERAIEVMSRKGQGVLCSPPRTGKTIMMTQVLINLGQKSLILAHQNDLLEQFCNETINHNEAHLFNGVRLKEPIAGICKTLDDFKRFDICLCTYQTFLSDKGKRLLNRIKSMFGAVLVDECHRAPAERYSQILCKFSAKHLIACSATPDRKDQKYFLAQLILGKVNYKTKVKTLTAKIYGRVTPFKNPRPPKTWTGVVNYLARHPERNMMIARTAIRDVRRGHHVLIPVARVEQAVTLKRMIDHLYGKEVSILFTGQIPKDKRQYVRDRMNNDPRIKVTLAMASMLTGVNVPRWSAIYSQWLISNQPNYEQYIARVLTPMEGKRTPVIRYFHDPDAVGGPAHGCLRTCCKTLLDSDRGFKVHESFYRMLGYKKQPSNSNRTLDDVEVYRSPETQGRLKL